MNLNNIINLLNEEVKLKEHESWDNSGLQLGSMEVNINKIMLTLDINKEAIEYAVQHKVDLIITHHPFFFGSIRKIDFDTYDGEIIKMLIKENINVYSMHTSYDMADKGVTYSLAKRLNILNYQVLHPINIDNSGYGGIGDVAPVNIIEYTKLVKEALGAEYVKLYCNGEKTVRRVAFCGGSGGEFIEDAIRQKADLYITGDIKYHQAQEAVKNNLCIIDAGHYNTEIYSMETLMEVLEKTGLEIINFKKNITAEKII
ncbi:MAG TPA: Nif3-like dinuclear metal center hexameric protein [Sedimentibacter sp.]|jgi:dinuclear metal center YbgI/SA1388 family protein|nr:Nif3-like dinuclear metal center hexameric protein [Sedimentibacter sp.]NLA14426.1 Nif3-like dinuclear metal center hexameric protein [Tissierellia bacterium]HOA19143.1 Nif3-like dinuclear metal center hexameric protein [Sedimentibacter sp.]HOG62324.1 Nif3-like dinuclear metal center hexameric protein [Sedimentibacter sp.]HPB78814.1 Nif3-like dinuclear metal center hexameric protein [Sedimentibacter sp.]